jgi:competence protein ComEA
MGAKPVIYSSVSGPAKWAAVVGLTAACSAGLTYSLMREPGGAKVSSPVVTELPRRQASPPVSALPPRVVETRPVAATVVPAPLAPNPESAPAALAAPEAATPVVAPVSEPEPPSPAAPSVARKINVNTATQAELELLPRIGPATAKAIIGHRSLHGPFRSVQDLDKVKGIGPKTLERLAPFVTVD